MSDDSKPKEAKPGFPGKFHGQVHERMTERGERLVKFPKTKPDGSVEYGARKIPNKVKVTHEWDHNTKEWKHKSTENLVNHSNTVTSRGNTATAKTPEDAAKERMNQASSSAESKPKTVVRKLKKANSMDKLLELEKRLREAKAELEKTVNQAYTAKAENSKKKKHDDEEEDKEMIAEAIDEHNEKKHGEPKDEDSAKKDLEKAEDKIKPLKSDKVQRTAPGARQPAYITGVSGPEKTSVINLAVAPEDQVAAQNKAKADKKAKFEAEAKERRAGYRKQGLLKFDANGQWSMDNDN